MRIGLISDTHGRLRPAVFDALAGVDAILHAGDVGPPEILVELEALAPVHAVFGNTDGFELRGRATETLDVELEGHRVLIVHGHQLGATTPQLLHAAYPGRDIIVYGHTHRQRVDEIDGCLVVNPGAAGPARFSLVPSVAVLTLERGAAPQVEHIPLAKH
jgi:uncharacterized protein